MSDKAQVNFTVDRNAKELAKEKLDYGELSTVLRERVHQVAFGEEISKRERMRKRLAELREEKDNLRNKKRNIEAELEEIETEITRLEERIDDMERREDKYETSLEMIEESLYDGMRVFEEHGQVIKAAKLGGKEPEDVIQELKERNPAIPDHAFVDRMTDPTDWNGVDSDGDAPIVEG